MEFKDSWHFVNSEENRVRLSAYWTATLFAVDCGWNVSRVGLELAALERETYDHLKRNVNFVLDALPVSYQEKVAEITKLLFGESRRHIIPVGKSFTVEDAQARQPDTEDFLDVKNLDPGMFASPPTEDPPKPAAGDGAPGASTSVSITVKTPEVVLKSKPKKQHQRLPRHPPQLQEPAQAHTGRSCLRAQLGSMFRVMSSHIGWKTTFPSINILW